MQALKVEDGTTQNKGGKTRKSSMGTKKDDRHVGMNVSRIRASGFVIKTGHANQRRYVFSFWAKFKI